MAGVGPDLFAGVRTRTNPYALCVANWARIPRPTPYLTNLATTKSSRLEESALHVRLGFRKALHLFRPKTAGKKGTWIVTPFEL